MMPSDQSIRLVYLEDDPGACSLVQALLAEDGLACTLDWVEDESGFRSAVHPRAPDLILADFNLPTMTGLRALELKEELCPTIPFIFVSGSLGESVAINALQHGATDFVLKDSMARLPSAVRRALAEAQQLRDKLAAEQERRAHLLFFEKLDRINRAIQTAADLEQMMSGVLETILEVFACDRAWLAYPCDPDAPSWRIPMERSHPNYPSQIPAGTNVPMTAEAAAAMRLIRDASGPVRFDPAAEHPLPAGMAHPYGVQSFIGTLLTPKVGPPWLFGLHQCAYPRIWTKEDEKLLQEVGRRLSDGLTSLLTYRNLRDANARVGEILESITDAFVALDREWCFTYVNERAAQMIGRHRSELLGANARALLPEILGSDAHQHVEKALADQIPRDFVFFGPSHGRWFESHVFPSKEGLSIYSTDISDRKRAEEALHKQEEEFRALAENAPDAVARYDRHCRFSYVNPAGEELFGTQLVGKTPVEIFPSDPGIALLQRKLQEVLATAKSVQFENTVAVARASSPAWHHVRMVPERDSAGTVASVLCITRDITALKETERQFRTLTEHSPDIICRFDCDGRYLYVNASLERLLGISAKEVLGQRLGESCTTSGTRAGTDKIAAMSDAIQQVFASGQAAELEIVLPLSDGDHFFNIRLVPECESSGQVVSVLYIGRDVTQRKRAEEAVLWRTAFFEAQVESALDGILVVDTRGKKIVQNQRMNEIWKFPPEIIAARDHSVQLAYAASRTKNPRQFGEKVAHLYSHPDEISQDEIELVDGTLLERYSSPVRDQAGRHYGRIWTVRDVTERRKLEEQFRQAQKMDAIGQLAGGIAHDFNNLLSVVQMQSSLLLSEPADEKETREGIQQIMAASERAANLTRQLLTFSRRSVREAKDIDLAEVTGTMTKLIRRILGEDVALETRFAPALPLVNADVGMMEQVLMNLAVNARDAMPHGGRLMVSLAAVTITPEYVAAQPRARSGRFVRLGVTDGGCGIPPENLTRIFDPFFTTKEIGKGTGLGLATVFGIVEQHHGWIEVISAVGQGSTFHVFLPALEMSVSQAAAAARKMDVRGGTETILLVEDDATVRKLARAVLDRSGYHVIEADSAASALKRWDERIKPVDLLLTDLVMPGGMAGRELADLLTNRQPGLKVIFTSGYSNELVNRQLQLEPGRNFLAKPCSAFELASTVRRRLDEV